MENKSIQKKRSKLLRIMTIVIVFFLILVGGGLFALSWYNTAIYQPSSTSEEDITFTVNPGDSLFTIADELESVGLVKNKDALKLYIRLNDLNPNIKPGQYSFPHNLIVPEIIDLLEKGVFKPSTAVTIQEGLRDKSIGELISSQLSEGGETKKFSLDEFMDIVNNPDDYDFSPSIEEFLELTKPAGKPLSGFLFPDTYRFNTDATATEVIETMITNFKKRLNDNQIDVSNVTTNQRELTSFYDILCLASILEKEAGGDEDDNLIAGVFYNRLEQNYPLESDVTVNYATGKDTLLVTFEDLKIDSPYNTYKYVGVTPTPINNTGIRSIKAALNPEDTNYFYFWRSSTLFKTFFGVTFADHQRNIVNYP